MSTQGFIAEQEMIPVDEIQLSVRDKIDASKQAATASTKSTEDEEHKEKEKEKEHKKTIELEEKKQESLSLTQTREPTEEKHAVAEDAVPVPLPEKPVMILTSKIKVLRKIETSGHNSFHHLIWLVEYEGERHVLKSSKLDDEFEVYHQFAMSFEVAFITPEIASAGFLVVDDAGKIPLMDGEKEAKPIIGSIHYMSPYIPDLKNLSQRRSEVRHLHREGVGVDSMEEKIAQGRVKHMGMVYATFHCGMENDARGGNIGIVRIKKSDTHNPSSRDDKQKSKSEFKCVLWDWDQRLRPDLFADETLFVLDLKTLAIAPFTNQAVYNFMDQRQGGVAKAACNIKLPQVSDITNPLIKDDYYCVMARRMLMKPYYLQLMQKRFGTIPIEWSGLYKGKKTLQEYFTFIFTEKAEQISIGMFKLAPGRAYLNEHLPEVKAFCLKQLAKFPAHEGAIPLIQHLPSNIDQLLSQGMQHFRDQLADRRLSIYDFFKENRCLIAGKKLTQLGIIVGACIGIYWLIRVGVGPEAEIISPGATTGLAAALGVLINLLVEYCKRYAAQYSLPSFDGFRRVLNPVYYEAKAIAVETGRESKATPSATGFATLTHSGSPLHHSAPQAQRQTLAIQGETVATRTTADQDGLADHMAPQIP